MPCWDSPLTARWNIPRHTITDGADITTATIAANMSDRHTIRNTTKRIIAKNTRSIIRNTTATKRARNIANIIIIITMKIDPVERIIGQATC